MKSKRLWWILGGLGLLFMLSALVITLVEFNHYRDQPIVFPGGSTIAGLPVSGVDEEEAAQRIADYFQLPLTLKIDNASLQADPTELGLDISPSNLAAEGTAQIEAQSFWQYLWGKNQPQPVTFPLDASFDENQLLAYLNREIVPRYSQPDSPIMPVPGTTNFINSQNGAQIDLERSLEDISQALLDPTIHSVSLTTKATSSSTANMEILAAFLQHQIDWMGFDELVEIYAESMDTGEHMHIAVQDGTLVEPDIAFTAGSTIKIPIMISVLRRMDETTPAEVVDLLERMIIYSENPPADTLMSTYIDEIRGPLIVSEDLAELGMANSFLAGYFYLGAPVLQVFETPANSRPDIYLDPDIYNQSVPAEAGKLLTAIYHCADDGSGLLAETFPGEISPSECQLMINILSANKIGLLIEAGLPPEATAAHKHGWVQELDGLLHSMSDVAIILSPGGDYVLTVFVYDPDRLDFDEGNRLVARLSQTVYNFFNIDDQTYWWFD